jgi:O-antigen/teichoic acid export membrane protein
MSSTSDLNKTEHQVGGKSLGDKVKSGYMWTVLSNGVGQPLTFLFGIVLARILSPSDFGIIASCLLFIEIGSTLVGASFQSGLIQKKDLSKRDISTAFILQFTTSLVVALLVIGISPLASMVLGESLVMPVLSLLSLNFILLNFCVIPGVLARRNLNFKLITKAEISDKFVNGVIASGLAILGWGVWSLVIGRLLGRATYAIVLFYATKWRPSIQFDKASASYLWRICIKFATKEILDDTARNIDYFLVGWRLGMFPLGFYSRAYNLMTLPIINLSKSLSTVLFPAFSLIQDEDHRIIKGMLKANCAIALTTFPLLVGLMLVGPAFIPFVYGAKWLPTVQPLQIMCIAGLFYSIDTTAISVINAKAYLIPEIRRQIIHMVLLVLGVLIGSRWGLIGVSWGVTITASIYWLLLLQLLKSRINLPFRDYFESLLPALISCIIMGFLVLLFQNTLLPRYFNNSYLMNLLGSMIIGFLSYIFAILIFGRLITTPFIEETYHEIAKFLVGLRFGVLAVFKKN